MAYNRLLTTVDRNAFLAEWTRFKLENPKLVMDNVKKNLKQEDPVKLYDLAITTLEEAQKLPVMELDPSLAVIVDALILAQKANRALYILSLYSQSGKIQEACGLLARCNEYVTSARSLLYSAKRGSVEDSELVQAQSQVEALAGRIKMEQIRLSAFLTLEQITDLNRLSSGIEKLTLGKSALSSSQPTRNNNSLIDFPPRFLPAPFKPLLFDMAFDSLSEYDLSEIEGIVKASEPASKGGITGVLASLWGR